MIQHSKDGLSRAGLDAAFEADESRVGNLLIEARMLRDRQQPDQARLRFAQAAEIEERLAAVCCEKGLRELSFLHHFSAAGCWGHAGNLHDALELCDELLSSSDLPDTYRKSVHEYAERLRGEVAELTARRLTAGQMAHSET